jgi:hypothetical protein
MKVCFLLTPFLQRLPHSCAPFALCARVGGKAFGMVPSSGRAMQVFY